MQMLDRLSLGLVSLPEATYETIILLSDADGSRTESRTLVGRQIFEILVKALRPNGRLRSQDGMLGKDEGPEKNEAILAGLASAPDGGFVKPSYDTSESVPLRFGKKNGVAKAAGGLIQPQPGAVSVQLNGKRKSEESSNGLPAGVAFDDGTDGLEDATIDSDDDLIDEDTLLDEEDFKRPIKIREFRDF